jgi:AcrR family transcriptional regulator
MAMGRPKEHNDHTATALLDAAERIVEREGMPALSVRRVANDVGASTRAVYSLFGAKEGLVSALGARAFDLLGEMVSALPSTDDPAADVIQAGLTFCRFALEHPALFQIGVQRTEVDTQTARSFSGSADRALVALRERLGRLQDAGLMGDRTLETATWEFHALCEGLSSMDARCGYRGTEAERLWVDALSALVNGWAASATSGTLLRTSHSH